MRLLLRVLLPALLLALSASPVLAQIGVNVDTLSFAGRSSWEDGHLATFSMDRVPLGARMTSMGGAGLALAGGSEYQSLNPASILGVTAIELQSEAVIHSGGGGVKSFPNLLELGPNVFLTTSNYRVSPKEDLNYNSLSLGAPLVLLGQRGALAVSYHRVARTGQADETRVELRGPITQDLDATFGLGDKPEEGMDAVSVALARRVSSWLDVGVNLNWQSGKLQRDTDIGVSVFGAEIAGGGTAFQQDVSGFTIDLGTQIHLGRLNLAGVLYLGHDLEFDPSVQENSPTPDPTRPNQRFFILTEVLPHTLSVPTMIGLGSSFALTDRLTLAGDFWIRPWSDAEVTRQEITPFFGFLDDEDPTSFFATLARGDGKETFNARLEDTNSLRLGLEYMAVDGERFSVPLRLGYRSEKLTLSNIRVPNEYARFDSVLFSYFLGTGDAEAQEEMIGEVLEFNHLLFRNDSPDASVITFGAGIRIDSFSADLSVQRTSYDIERFFLNPFDPLLNPVTTTAKEDRSILTLSLTTRMRF